MKMPSIDLNKIEKDVMSELKDFQEFTVDRIIDLFTKEGQDRILVSDEVGLGKTLVARGTIAKFAKYREEKGDDLVKVIYICSNATIADQNLEKLRLVDEIQVDNSSNSRLSMQHLNIFKKENDEMVKEGYIQLIPLTPATSFKIQNSEGKIEERALIFSILQKVPQLENFSNELKEILKFRVKNENNWNYQINEYIKQVDNCNTISNGKYLEYMINSLTKGENNLFMDYLSDYCRTGEFDKYKNREIIIELRKIFADISLNKLDPDLIIMDEFQRFKDLIKSNKETEVSKLTNKFFNSEDVKIMMLSATPYKMYSTLDEIDEENIDEHYSEFLDVMKFLNIDNFNNFKVIWDNYSLKLKEFSRDDLSFLSIKSRAENELYKNICRTERITESKITDIFEDIDSEDSLIVNVDDIKSYLQIQEILDYVIPGSQVPMDYIKSSPYLMSFMWGYKLKMEILEHFKSNPTEVNKMNQSTFWITKRDIQNYNELKYTNARLINLIDKVIDNNEEKLLWIPPSMPYYELKGPFENTRNFSKTLIFSSWEMVPRMISSLLSYEAERRTIGKLKHDADYFSDNRYPSSRLIFSYDKDGVNNMSLLTLVYPSKFLSEVYNPIECLNNKLSLEKIEKQIIDKIEKKLDDFKEYGNKVDYDWYYLAPLLLDYKSGYAHFTEEWFKQLDLDDYDDKEKPFFKHLIYYESKFKNINKLKFRLGKKPDDLSEVLCNLAIASPAICLYRLYKKGLNDNELRVFELIKNFTLRFMNYFNSPEATAVVDSCYNSKRNYWKKVLRYSKEGNLQAVLDEYVHILSDGLNMDKSDKLKNINQKIISSMYLFNAPYKVDTYDNFISQIKYDDNSPIKLRTHFAVSFIKGDGSDEDGDRKKSVRSSFNSPFRPFVLTSTSIGQEGLDFHNYCRRIVHWNLPSNPIDIEQREGRINRYKCLVIRQNIAKRYGKIDFSHDIWNELFEEASKEKSLISSDLIPYWGLTNTNDMIKIERIIPMYPFSRDKTKFKRLKKILQLYRLTLGQSNQKFLIDLLSENINQNIDIHDLFINLSPYYKYIEDIKNSQTTLDMFN